MKKCARCDKRLGELRIFSSWTRSYYCIDIDACTRRAKRRAKGGRAIPAPSPSSSDGSGAVPAVAAENASYRF